MRGLLHEIDERPALLKSHMAVEGKVSMLFVTDTESSVTSAKFGGT